MLGLSLLIAFMVGCASMNGSTTGTVSTDPLFGPAIDRKAGDKVPAVKGSVAVLPPMPAPAAAASNAALASGTHRLLTDDNDLRIGPRPGGAPQDSWASTNPGGAQPNRNSGAVLRNPEPTSEFTRDREPAPAAVPVSREEKPNSTYEQVQAELTARGVLWQKLDRIGENEWKFSCIVPNKRDPRLRRTYVAGANDSLAAMRAVLEQMDAD